VLDPIYVRDHLDEVAARLRDRGIDPSADLERFAALEAERRRLIPEVEALKREQNAAGEAVARAKKAGEDPSGVFAANRERGGRIKALEAELADVDRRRDAILLTVPNLPHESVPRGASPADNVEARTWGELPRFGFEPKPHWDLGAALGILDFERATRMSGARSAPARGSGARSSISCSTCTRASTATRKSSRRSSSTPRRSPAPAICRSSSRTSSRWRGSGTCI
jgi:seryl-tRNA synthetase